jgi:hypothetical protein
MSQLCQLVFDDRAVAFTARKLPLSHGEFVLAAIIEPGGGTVVDHSGPLVRSGSPLVRQFEARHPRDTNAPALNAR